MSIFKCKMCGGDLNIAAGEKVAECEYCGSKQTLPKLDDDRRVNLYDRANHFRRNNEFDKAAGIYEQILNEDKTDAEAYWSLVLCRYGIEYVEDPATHKRVPTVNRAQFTSIFDDDNYKSALQYADTLQKGIYESEAKAINEIQKGILAISQKEEPFDVFICYKETDQNGRRTPDSVLATDLYHQLTQEGFKVFFSRITLEDKLGTAYEPYIFAALNSAKVMVVLGTKPEYFNAVWVKNEWSRYLALVKKSGGKKILIPAYKDMDPYNLPEEFSHLQAQDMGKLGFMQDLIRGIKKIAKTDEPKAAVKETVVVGTVNANIAPLLERAFLFLEDGKWQDANIYCEKVLDIDPKNAEAYLGKLMADLQVRSRKQLADCADPFDDRENYGKVLRFGDEKLEAELRGYITHINERNETARLTGIYNGAVSAMNTANTESAYKAAADTFKTIPGFQDADSLAEQCLDKAEERRIAAEKATKKRKKIIAIAAPVIVVCIVFIIVLITIIIPTTKYNAAQDLYNAGKYEEALAAFTALDDYSDAKTRCAALLKELSEWLTIPVEVEYTGTLPDGYVRDPAVLDRETVSVSGPAEEVNKIARAILTVDLNEVTDSIDEEMEYRLVDQNGETLEFSYPVQIDVPTVRVSVPVFSYKLITLKVNLIPGGGATEKNVKLTIEPATIAVSGSEEALKDLEEFVIKEIDLAQITDTQFWTVTPDLPAGVTNRASRKTVTVTLSITGLSTKRIAFPCSEIERINDVETMEFAEQSVVITIRGTSTALAAIRESDLRVIADMKKGYDAATKTVALEIILPDNTTAGVVGGEYVVQVIETAA